MDYLNRTLDPSTTATVDGQLQNGRWRLETIPPSLTGLTRPIRVIRGRRRKTLLTFNWHGDAATFCPPKWWDLAIGAGACGFGCRACFLMLTFRAMSDPLRHRLYDNLNDYAAVVGDWLKARAWPHPRQKGKMVKLDSRTTLGLGIDRSDSLLYEGVTGHARRLIPLFANSESNPQGRRLVLLTKSANVRYLDWRRNDDEFPAFSQTCRAVYETHGSIPNVSLTFSLNPDPIADLWEGKWPDTLGRITPHTDHRLEAARTACELGFDVRWRLDPILPLEGWRELYRAWLEKAVDDFDARPSRITLGTYREKNAQLDLWRAKWGLPPMEWSPAGLAQDGTHRHLSGQDRAEIYGFIRDCIVDVWQGRGRSAPAVALCKESHALRRGLGLCNAQCNCLE